MSNPGGAWVVEERRAEAAELLGPWPDPTEQSRRRLSVCHLTGRRALVLGSSQDDQAVNRTVLAEADVEVATRRSGGGAVLVERGAQVWVEAWLPRGDPLWDDDVIRGATWFGRWWAGALGDIGVRGMSVHQGRAERSRLAGKVCFAGVGPGEVSVGVRKLVGLSQRRTRHGVRLQAMAHVSWEPELLADLLALGADDRGRLRDACCGLVDVVFGTQGPDGVAEEVVDALLRGAP